MYAAYSLVVLAVALSAADFGRTAEAAEMGYCKLLVERGAKIINAVKRYGRVSIPACKCGESLSRIEVYNRDTKETSTLDLCRRCTGTQVPVHKSEFCETPHQISYANFVPFCKGALDQCSGKDIQIYRCNCQVGSEATTELPVPETTTAPADSVTTAPVQVSTLDWMNY